MTKMCFGLLLAIGHICLGSSQGDMGTSTGEQMAQRLEKLGRYLETGRPVYVTENKYLFSL